MNERLHRMSQFGATGKNPPWMRTPELSLSGGTMLAMAQPPHSAAAAAGVATNPGLATAINQSQATAQPSQAFGTNLAALGLSQNALQATTVLPQPGIAIPASLAAATTASVGTAGIGLPTTLATTQVASISYPTQRILASTPQYATTPTPSVANPVMNQAVTGPGNAASAAVPSPVPPPGVSAKQRVFTGTVTKLHDNFGFVDEEVFFQTSVVKGTMPKVGERVLVEASYNPTMPFKWNAYRIQLLANQVNSQHTNSRQGVQGTSSNQLSINSAIAAQTQYINSVMSSGGGRPSRRIPSPTPPRRERDTRRDERRERFRDREFDRDRKPYDRDRNRSPTRDRDRRSPFSRDSRRPSPDRERRASSLERDYRGPDYERGRSPSDFERRSPVNSKRPLSPSRVSRSPPRRKARVLPRYIVEIPNTSLDVREASVIDLKKRYPNMYIPSDFFHTSFLWQEAFPLHRPFSLDHSCSFHVLSKDIDSLIDNSSVIDPPDLDFSYSAKVMLLASLPLQELYKKTCALAEDTRDAKESAIHPARAISFLVGLKGKSETVAIGGPWSPSLDGSDPDKDPQVLIRTAIRTCRALTGIDLNPCTQWYRFAEICYRRESSHKGRSTHAEKVVIFMPDVWRCVPTQQEWDSIGRQLHLDADDNQEEDNNVLENEPENLEPTRFSQLDPKTMKVVDLRRELDVRGLGTKGLKSQLITRLTKALKAEAEKEGAVESETGDKTEEENSLSKKEETKVTDMLKENEEMKKDEECKVSEETQKEEQEDKEVRETEDDKLLDGKTKDGKETETRSKETKDEKREGSNEEKSQNLSDLIKLVENKLQGALGKLKDGKLSEGKDDLRREFVPDIKIALPETPTILVQPSKTAKGGRFDCTVMSLSLLLDYRQEDNKEHSFEVSLFAELFNEMLIRDFGFNIYKALVEAPEPKDEKEKKREKKESGKEREEKKNDKKDERKEERKLEKKDDRKEKKDDMRKDERKVDYEQEDSDMFSEASDADNDDSEETKDRKLKKERGLQLRTVNKHLLLSFIYFDQNQCGYLIDKDLEDILYVLGLKLSRGQTRRLLQKVVRKEQLFYRRLTDKYTTNEDGFPKDSLLDVQDLSQGNRKLIALNTEEKNSQAVSQVESVMNSGVVYHDGAILDVNKLLKQVERSEKAQASAESKLKDIIKELGEVKESSDITKQNAQKTQVELDLCKRKLESTELELQTVKKQSAELLSALQNCHQHLQATLSSLDTVLGRSSAKKEDFKLEIKVEKID